MFNSNTEPLKERKNRNGYFENWRNTINLRGDMMGFDLEMDDYDNPQRELFKKKRKKPFP